MIDSEVAKHLERLRWLWDRFQLYYKSEDQRSYTRARRLAWMHMELDYRFRCAMGGNISSAR